MKPKLTKPAPNQRGQNHNLMTWQAHIKTLKTQAAKSGITQNQIAEKTGLKQPNIARFFSGHSCPTLDTFLKVAEAVGVNFQLSPKNYDTMKEIFLHPKNTEQMHPNSTRSVFRFEGEEYEAKTTLNAIRVPLDIGAKMVAQDPQGFDLVYTSDFQEALIASGRSDDYPHLVRDVIGIY